MNLAINGSITKSPASVWNVSNKAEPAAVEIQGKTFQNVLGETIGKKSASNKTLVYGVNYISSTAAGNGNAIMDYREAETGIEANERTPNKATMHAGSEGQAKASDEITKFEKVQIAGIWVTQMTDEYLTHLGYNVEILKANDLGRNLRHIDKNGFAPKYVVPLDLTGGIDYATTLATPENLAKTAKDDAVFSSKWATAAASVNNVLLRPAASKVAAVEDNKHTGQNDVKPPLKEAVKEDRVSQGDIHKPSEKAEDLSKTTAGDAALRLLYNLNILDIWDSKEKEDEKK